MIIYLLSQILLSIVLVIVGAGIVLILAKIIGWIFGDSLL